MKKIALIIILIVFIFSLTVYGEKGQTEYLELPEEGKRKEQIELKIGDLKWKTGKITEPIEGNKLLTFRGIDFYPKPKPYSQGFDSLEALLRIKEVNWIQLRFFLYQDKESSNNVRIDSEQDKVLKEMIKKIKESGRKVSLHPHLVVNNYKSWAGVIQPESIGEWFNSYRKALLHYAELAEKNGVDLFPIANEFITVWKYNQEWEKTINMVRNNYDGKITIKLNAWWEKDYLDKILSWNWIEKLDLLGVSPYFDLIRKKEVTREEIKKSWRETYHGIDVVGSFEKIHNEFDLEIVFLEIGYRAVKGSVMEPWNYCQNIPRDSKTEAVSSQRSQTVATEVLFDVFQDKHWFKGVFIFYWPTEIVIDPKGKGWDIPGKEVEEVIWENFRKAKRE